jgi:ketosteroid isomerase-like protein
VPDAATTQLLNEVYDGFVEGDLERVGRGMTDDVVAIDPPYVPDGGTFTGREAVLARLAGFIDLFEAIELTGLRFDDVGDRVVASFTAHGRARLGGAEAALQIAHLLRFRDGLIAEMRVFVGDASRRDAEAAAGSP